MYDKEFIRSVLINVNNSVDMIIYRFSKVDSATDFISNNDGLEILDSISIRLQLLVNHLKK